METVNAKPKVIINGMNRFLYDFHICAEYDELAQTIEYINYHGHDLITVTQDSRGFFTVFFRRRVSG